LSFIVSLLVVKTIATALAAGSGLVVGTFASSLFLGAMTGAAFHQVATTVLQLDMFHGNIEIADGPAYAIVALPVWWPPCFGRR
jgi:H+/Cl- antiporter ClcA